MTWIQPLDLKTWFINVLSGDATYFAPIAIFAILTMAGYFRMSGLTMGFMVMIFLGMFSGFLSPSFLIFAAILGGLGIGWSISRIVKN